HNIDIDLASLGRWQDDGGSRNACVTYAGQKPIAVASVTHATTTGTFTTAMPHGLKVGWSITGKGFTDALYNATYTVATVTSATVFTATLAGTPAADTIPGAQGTSTLCDASKTWTVNQWAGYVCYMTTSTVTAASGLATGQALQVASNTANTLTFTVAGTAPVNGVSRYVLAKQTVPGALDSGIAT